MSIGDIQKMNKENEQQIKQILSTFYEERFNMSFLEVTNFSVKSNEKKLLRWLIKKGLINLEKLKVE